MSAHSSGSVAAALALVTLTLGACGPKAPAGPNIQTREVEYKAGDTVLKGFIAWDSAHAGKRPGVLVVHEWWGHNEHARNAARKLAEAGYVGFALDLYGNGKSTTHPDSAVAFMNAAMADPAALNARFVAAREELLKDPHVDPARIAAIGYCFGGAVVLGQARAGADLAAVASFHGAIPPGKADSGKVKARILILTGADDPMVPATAVENYRKAVAAAGGRVEVVTYPGAKHSFTNPRADSSGVPGLAYNADAAQKSWEAMLAMFRETLGR